MRPVVIFAAFIDGSAGLSPNETDRSHQDSDSVRFWTGIAFARHNGFENFDSKGWRSPNGKRLRSESAEYLSASIQAAKKLIFAYSTHVEKPARPHQASQLPHFFQTTITARLRPRSKRMICAYQQIGVR